jgi:hypothetical protein
MMWKISVLILKLQFFHLKGKLKPADKFKIELMNKMIINIDSKLIETQPLVNIEKPTLKNIENSL